MIYSHKLFSFWNFHPYQSLVFCLGNPLAQYQSTFFFNALFELSWVPWAEWDQEYFLRKLSKPIERLKTLHIFSLLAVLHYTTIPFKRKMTAFITLAIQAARTFSKRFTDSGRHVLDTAVSCINLIVYRDWKGLLEHHLNRLFFLSHRNSSEEFSSTHNFLTLSNSKESCPSKLYLQGYLRLYQ